MTPEIEQFLSGMKKTMEEVVLPNLTDRFAQEQAGIVAATLGFLSTIHDKVFHYELFENREYKDILQDVISGLENSGEQENDIQEVISKINKHFSKDRPEDQSALRPYAFLRASNETMRELLCELIQLQPAMLADTRAQFEARLKPFFRSLETRERSWVKGLGFDPEADQQADIAELLYDEKGFLRGGK